MDVYATVGIIFWLFTFCHPQLHPQNMDLLYTITHPSRIHDLKFCSFTAGKGEILLVGAEDRKLSVYHVPDTSETPFIVAEMIGHSNRLVVFLKTLSKHQLIDRFVA